MHKGRTQLLHRRLMHVAHTGSKFHQVNLTSEYTARSDRDSVRAVRTGVKIAKADPHTANYSIPVSASAFVLYISQPTNVVVHMASF